jgi:hypothetical protein
MSVIKIYDDCLYPDKVFIFRYEGKNTWKVINNITDSVKQHFHVTRGEWNQFDLRWDATDDPIWFFSQWWMAPMFSTNPESRMMLVLKVRGCEGKTDKMGWFNMIMTAHLQTEFRGWGPLLKVFYPIYSYLFYNKIRRSNIEKCKDLSLEIKNLVRDMYNLEILAREPESW